MLLLWGFALMGIQIPGILAGFSHTDQIPNGQKLGRADIGDHPFLGDFAAHGHKWTRELCRLDSDENGLTNGQELGDPDCVWSPGAPFPFVNKLNNPGLLEPQSSTENQAENLKSDVDDNNSSNEMECEYFNEPEVQSRSLRMGNATIPAEGTTYMCQLFRIPADRAYHFIGARFVLDNYDLVHHMGLQGCDDTVDGQEGPVRCDALNDKIDSKCNNVFTIHNQGLTGSCLPPEVGIRIGQGGYSIILLQVHWTNMDLLENLTDTSGFEIYYTPKLRPHNAGIFSVGQTGMIIPPGQPSTVFTGNCTASCTRGLLRGPIHVLTVLNHMHFLGKTQRATLMRSGLPDFALTNDQHYTYGSPQMHEYTPPVAINPGDEVSVMCEYDSTSRNTTTTFGATSLDEMCFVYMTFYPLENVVERDVSWALSCFQEGETSNC